MFASLSNSSPVAISLETAIFKAIVSRVPSRSVCMQTDLWTEDHEEGKTADVLITKVGSISERKWQSVALSKSTFITNSVRTR